MLKYICFLLSVILLSGCATIIEGAKGVAGVSTKALEEGRKEAITKAFNYSYDKCYAQVKEVLKHAGSYIYAEDAQKKMIAIYISETDTTPVGIFFKTLDDNHTQIEASSPSTYAKELIAGRISKAFEPQKEKGESDAKGEKPNK